MRAEGCASQAMDGRLARRFRHESRLVQRDVCVAQWLGAASCMWELWGKLKLSNRGRRGDGSCRCTARPSVVLSPMFQAMAWREGHWKRKRKWWIKHLLARLDSHAAESGGILLSKFIFIMICSSSPYNSVPENPILRTRFHYAKPPGYSSL
jgi:hypothetical protein